tara:strand:- start:271 stop:1512 length:1242 start_codon:yes stop_codon:yes gene_type:complete
MRLNKKAFTLVEMLVALAVSSIIIAATFASFELVQKQYKKNIDIAELHTSGRAVMSILEREIRMAGYEFRDGNGMMTYGPITGPLIITDSGDKCCDEVTIIYDEVFDTLNASGVVTSSIVERVKTRFWTESYNSSKHGDRYRLFKRRTILGTNNALLGTPRVGAKEVMADFIEDLQITNISTTGTLYGSGSRVNSIGIWNPTRPKNDRKVGSISTPSGYQGLTFGPDGRLYGSGTRVNTIEIWRGNSKVDSISTPSGYEGLTFGPDGRLYGSGSRVNTIEIWDVTKTKGNRKVDSISTPSGYQGLTFGPDGLLYGSGSRVNTIEIWDVTKPKGNRKVDSISTPSGYQGLVFDIKKIGQLNVVSINLTLRAKNKYGNISKKFLKKDYFSGNFNFTKNDLFMRDTLSTTVSVRNL